MNAENKNTTEGQQNEGGRTYTQEDINIIKKYCALPDNVKNIINGLILAGDQIAAAGNTSEAPKEKTEAEILAEKEKEAKVNRFKKELEKTNNFCMKNKIFCNLEIAKIALFLDNLDKYDILVGAYNLGAKKAFLKAKKNTSRA